VLTALSPGDLVYCTVFNDKIQVLCVADKAAEIAVPLLKALVKIKPSGSTALWDAILPSLEIAMKVYSLDMMASASADKLDYHMICVLTDGEDTASQCKRTDIGDVLKALHKKLPRFQSIFIGVDLARAAKTELNSLVSSVDDADCQYMDASSDKIGEVFTKVVVKIQETVSFLASDGQTVIVGQVGGDSASMVYDPLRGSSTVSSTARVGSSSGTGRLALPAPPQTTTRSSAPRNYGTSSSATASSSSSSSRDSGSGGGGFGSWFGFGRSSSSNTSSSNTASAPKARKYY